MPAPEIVPSACRARGPQGLGALCPDGPGQVAWLGARAQQECLRILGAQTRHRERGGAPNVTADRAVAGGQAGLRSLFEGAAAGLRPAEREVVELALRHGLGPGELGAVLGMTDARARQLRSRAVDQLESSLGVLLVSRGGRADCAGLRALLTGWDGRLTAALRVTVAGHVEECAPCAARRARELGPARLGELSPQAALAAGAAESARRAPRPPTSLRARTIALASGDTPPAAAHRDAVLARAGAFAGAGFPSPPGAVPPQASPPTITELD